jgi:uncharacterized protein (DUF302 family)
MTYQRTINVNLPFGATLTRTREALAEQGFGVLREIDLQAALREKLSVQIEPYTILGACDPDLAHQALEIDRAIGALLPCNVVVRGAGERSGVTSVTILDPAVLPSLAARSELEPLAEEASRRLRAVLDTLNAASDA